MPKDRLQELLKASSSVANTKYNVISSWRKPSFDENPIKDNVMITKSKSTKKDMEREKNLLDGIFKQVNIISNWIESIKSDTAALKQCHIQLQQFTRPETSTKDKIQCLMGNIRSISSRTKGSLEEMRKRKENEMDNGIRRVMETQHLILSKNFSDAVEEYRTTLDHYKKRNEDILKKQLHITDKEVTNEELLNMLDSEDTAIFADDYLKEMSIARQQLVEARTRHAEILAIEKEITEIRNIFFELAMHVNIQGEMIDSIEYHVMKGLNKTQSGMDQLVKARKKKKMYRKNKIWLIVILTIVLLILLVILLH